ncbi:uroporphyrinogen-III C-methyltransferase [Evansella cellulosilytica]|uniref:Uroporphyrinogen-III C-methyltransferase n=1 Tax=Evansella cellulosilytica (strain ATCC 21833 / DSM 2522 / FERM P-1141 / JCM 9156 / N-4) TaxID=649639 RepID=E6TU76_EVAC2|nr:uroporphyrinogen-III C-methyltransferase [Evansella cellulosilytica]ADU28536.1 uroporphyrin-III C-methyltransferase [Evansella cellulosilytica DSM 2522]
MTNQTGFVSFVGAGPGDSGLITNKGLKSIKKADVILYDRLVNPRLLREAKKTCDFIYCGKLPNRHIMRQEKINETLIEQAKLGQYVVRLKGGDPSVFGRVGEEAEALVNEGIEYEIIPGVTSSIAAAAYAGIPVTHRDYSNSFTLRTGHASVTKETVDNTYNGQYLGETIAYYMGVKSLKTNCHTLIEQGKTPQTKVAVIEWATLGKQRVVEGTLETISDIVETENIKNPAMTIIGDVVSLRQKIKWFDKKKFIGKRVLVAKSSGTSFDLEDYFTGHGAEAYSFPTVKMEEAAFTNGELTKALQSDRIIFTAPESVDTFLSSMLNHSFDIRDLPRDIQFLSEKTRKKLMEKGIIATKAEFSEKTTAVISPSGKKIDQSLFVDSHVFRSHAWERDHRFDELNERILTEDNWQTVIFPNKASIDSFIAEIERLRIELKALSFAYIGESVKKYAIQCGFTHVDQEVQNDLENNKWKR